jgi:hypothetical protein
MYGSIDSTKSPASGIAIVSEPGLMSQVGESAPSRLRLDQCVSRFGAVGALGFLRTLSHVGSQKASGKLPVCPT